jgi:hypothetical protein
MENLKGILSLVLIISIGWHIKVYFFSETKLSGVFQEQPEYGYVWQNSEETNTRFFWEDTDVKWQIGTQHPLYNVYASTEKNSWLPLPGYKFINNTNSDLSTIWEPGQLHPNFNAWATNNEGFWIPVTGYKFVVENGVWNDVVWGPGQNYDNLKVISGEEKDSYIPYPGYKFTNPNVDLSVAWTPGIINTNYPDYIAGNIEGTWETRTEPVEPTASDYGWGWFLKGLASVGIKKAFGDNVVSDKLLEESTKDGIRGIIKAAQ